LHLFIKNQCVPLWLDLQWSGTAKQTYFSPSTVRSEEAQMPGLIMRRFAPPTAIAVAGACRMVA
jgi:hypothetical protein